jgi:sigma-B regulation protein RsbU (phosphoserine phosphatase)
VHLNAGDLMVLYSDGITEAVNTSDEEFGDERLTTLLVERREESAEQLAEAIINAATLHARGVPQGDDMTVVVVKRCA